MSFAERFWAKVLIAEGDGCWEWQRGRFPKGYGRVALPRHGNDTQPQEGAHRIAWLLTNGPIPDGLWVLHRCDNPPCCRPDHLFLGTLQDNVDDMVAKGRHRLGRHEPRRKFDLTFVVAIRQRAAAGESHRSIAASVAVNRRTVDRIVARRRYADVA